MEKREEYRKNKCFKDVEEKYRKLAKYISRDLAYRDESGEEYTEPKRRYYRVLTYPIDELEKWEEHGGYIPALSEWGRLVCSANRYLGCFIDKGFGPPHLQSVDVMIELHKYPLPCIEYSDAAVGNVPTIPSFNGSRRNDVYVSVRDLILAECWSENSVPIMDIKKIYINKYTLDEEVKKKAEEFAKKHNIPVEYNIPCPSDDNKVMKKGERPKDFGVTDKTLEDIGIYLYDRLEKCPLSELPPYDSVGAALAETYDETFHHNTPLGASDALAVKIKRLREKGKEIEKDCDKPTCPF